MAVLQVGQATLQGWLLSLTEVRLLTTCSKHWAAERPTCLSMLKGPPEEVNDPEVPETRLSENILLASFGCAALSRATARILPAQPKAQGSAAAQSAAASDSPFVVVTPRHLATMEWIPIAQTTGSNNSPSSTLSCMYTGSRQGGSAQGQLSGRGFPFTTTDLPGRYDGVGVGRSIHNKLIGTLEKVAKATSRNRKPLTTTVFTRKRVYAFVRMYVHRNVVRGCNRVGNRDMYVTCPQLT